MSDRMVYEATAPANIAFLKYWGKSDEQSQWPANNSLSMTLTNACTRTTAQKSTDRDHLVMINGVLVDRQHRNGQKVFRQLDYLAGKFNFDSPLIIKTANSFPTGCGIASSASGLAALTLAALSAWTESSGFEELATHGFDRTQLADLARMGSGSAGRSLFGGFVQWERGNDASSQTVKPVLAADHWELADVIVVISAQEKATSSSAGHKAAFSSPLMGPRLAGLAEREKAMLAALNDRDMNRLGPLLETEALEMHAVMLSMEPRAIYIGPETSAALAWLRELRARTGLQAYFTLDAGPNMHVICPKTEVPALVEHLSLRWSKEQLLIDQVGKGPTVGLAV